MLYEFIVTLLLERESVRQESLVFATKTIVDVSFDATSFSELRANLQVEDKTMRDDQSQVNSQR